MPTFAYSRSSDAAYEIACGSWGCPFCSRKKKMACRVAVEIGMSRAWASGNRVRFLTLTDGASGTMTVADLYKAWSKLRIKLRREGVLDQYAAVVETQERGALHLHCLATGSYVKQSKLAEFGSWAGFGPITDIREIKRDLPEDDKRAAAYVAKELAGYVSKGAEALAEKTNVRRRPVRFSRGWGCSLGQAEELVTQQMCEERGVERDGGPWVVVVKTPDGSLIVRGGEGLPRVVPPAQAEASAEEAGRQAVATEAGDAGAAQGQASEAAA